MFAGLSALVWLAITGQGQRWVWTVIQTCLILGSVFFATGLLGEQIAQQRAELRELRRELDDMGTDLNEHMNEHIADARPDTVAHGNASLDAPPVRGASLTS